VSEEEASKEVVVKDVGVLGSPNQLDTFTMDVLGDMLEEPLYGKLLKFDHFEKDAGDVRTLKVICQVAEIQNRNVWHEQVGMRSLIKVRGRLTNLSGDADLKLSSLSYLGSYVPSVDLWTPMNIGTPPRSGTKVTFVVQDDINYAAKANECGAWYLGKVPGTDLLVPFSIKHFGPVKEGGVGEARMFGVFGQSGSGKSIVAAEIITGFSKHEKMGVMIIDPQGEFYNNKFGGSTGFTFDFHDMVRKTKKELISYTIDEIQLEENVQIFIQLLKGRGIIKGMGMGTDEKVDAFCEYLENELNQKMIRQHLRIQNYTYAQFCDDAINIVQRIYQGEYGANKAGAINDTRRTSHALQQKFNGCLEFYRPNSPDGHQKIGLSNLIRAFLDGKMVIISMVCNDLIYEDKIMIVSQIVDKIINESETRYNSGSENLNGIIVLDEAHRYAPQKTQDDDLPDSAIRLRKQLEKATRETRKYCLGWLFITQSIVSFSKDIYRQLTDVWYGYGLTIGGDVEHVKSKIGEDSYALYAHFPNPKQTDKYHFVAYGGSVSLGTMGKPIAIEGFSSTDEFLKINKLKQD